MEKDDLRKLFLSLGVMTFTRKCTPVLLVKKDSPKEKN